MTASTMPDEVSIWQLLCRYCHLVDRGDMSDVVLLFHPEGTLILPPNPSATGREAIQRVYEQWDATARKPTAWLRHRISTPYIHVEGERASSVCYLTADFLLRKKNRVQALMGRYEDELVQHEARWLFLRREIIIHAGVAWGDPL